MKQMASQMNNAILAQMSPTEYQPSQQGGPNYIGSVDYPKTVYQGYIGSTNYTYEPRSTGYGIIDDSNMFIPVAKNPKSKEFKNLNRLNEIEPILGECSIPSYFQTSEDSVRRCNYRYSLFLFKAALIANTFVTLLLFKRSSINFTIGFMIFHLILYYLLTSVYVKTSVGEWKTIQKYKYNLKKDPDFIEFDSPIKQFEEINKYILDQAVNKRKMIYSIMIVSVMFCWIPLMFNVKN